MIRAWTAGGNTKGISLGLQKGLPVQEDLHKNTQARPNLAVQDATFGVAIMGYSRKRVGEKLRGQGSDDMTKRIYLNPRIADTTEIFADLLGAFDEQGLAVQIKMWGRESDLLRKAKAREITGSLRGDGLVVYAKEAEANGVLGIVLEVAERHSDAFVGRKLSRIPTPITEGIGVGDEPSEGSLTSHRAAFLESVTHETKRAGLTGQPAIDLFRATLRSKAPRWGINPNNLAFNQ